jgi:hypothetical protein
MIIALEHVRLNLIRHVGAQQKAAMRLERYSIETVDGCSPDSFVA